MGLISLFNFLLDVLLRYVLLEGKLFEAGLFFLIYYVELGVRGCVRQQVTFFIKFLRIFFLMFFLTFFELGRFFHICFLNFCTSFYVYRSEHIAKRIATSLHLLAS